MWYPSGIAQLNHVGCPHGTHGQLRTEPYPTLLDGGVLLDDRDAPLGRARPAAVTAPHHHHPAGGVGKHWQLPLAPWGGAIQHHIDLGN